MPIYEFECTDCKKTFEELVWTSYLEESIKCPKCGGKQVKKKITRFSAKVSAGSSLSSSSFGCGTTSSGST